MKIFSTIFMIIICLVLLKYNAPMLAAGIALYILMGFAGPVAKTHSTAGQHHQVAVVSNLNKE